MSRDNSVLINTDLPLQEIARRIGEFVGSEPKPVENLPAGAGPYYDVQLDHEMIGSVGDAGFPDDEPHVPWTAFRYVVVVENPWRRAEELQDEAAWALYRKIVANTTWTTMLVLDDGAEVAASRGILARSA
jgi:hypothetical protein